MNSKLNNRFVRVIGVPSISAVVLVCLHFFMFKPLTEYATRQRLQIKQKETELTDAEALIKVIPNPEKAITEIKKRIADFENTGVNKKQWPRIVQLLGNAAEQNKALTVVTIRQSEKFKPETEGLPPGISRVFVEVVVQGTYQSVADYLKSVSELKVPFSLASMVVEPFAGGSASGSGKEQKKKPEEQSSLIQASLVFTTFMFWEL